MKPEEALKIINDCIENGKIIQEAFDFSFFYAIKDALEKQVPKKTQGDFHSVPHYRCHECYGAVKLYENSNTFPYCPWCGQAIDGSDYND